MTAMSVVSDAHNSQLSLRFSCSMGSSATIVDAHRTRQNCKHYGTLMDAGLT